MMNIQVNGSLGSNSKGSVGNAGNNNTEVVMLQPAVVDDVGNLVQQQQQASPQIPKRRRSRLTEEAEAERKVKYFSFVLLA